MTFEIPEVAPAPAPLVPEPVRPDMSFQSRAEYSYVLYSEEVASEMRTWATITPFSGTRFAIEVTGVPEADIEKVIEDAIVNAEAQDSDPVINARANPSITFAQEI
tara:strand:- start:45 stop:362 length:318 start_codon:yes stop_codon:yes gene_type:complete